MCQLSLNCTHGADTHAEKKDGETPKQTAPFGVHSQTELRGDREYARLFEGNRLFVSQKLRADPNYFTRLSQGQQPKFLLIGCSDSRVPPDQLTMTEPGEIFIHRNVANIVVNTDMNAMSVLAYSVQSLKVRHVIVMGHYGCGGVKASMDDNHHGDIDKWLRHIKDVQRLHWDRLNACKTTEERFRLLVELNVKENALNICKTPILQQAWANGEDIHVHAWVYDLSTGYITDLGIEEKEWESLKPIYKLNFTKSKL